MARDLKVKWTPFLDHPVLRVFSRPQLDHQRRSGKSLRKLFAEFLDVPEVRAALVGASPTGPAVGHPAPLRGLDAELVADRAMLAGDAAGFVNPLSGESIEFALESGWLAAEAPVAAAATGDLTTRGLRRYREACRGRFLPTLFSIAACSMAWCAPPRPR